MPHATRLDITRSELIQAPPVRVLAAFFDGKDLAAWWQVARSVTVPRPLGTYAVEWESTDFKDEVLGRLGGTFHGTIIDYRPNGAFFVGEAYWQPPDGEPLGPMALEVHCRPHGNGRSTMLTIRQSADGARTPLGALLRAHEPRLGRRAAGHEGLHGSRVGADQELKTPLRWLFGILFILAGLNHFRSPDFYINIMPPYLPWHRELVAISGVAEIALGALLLFRRWAVLAGWGLIALLVAVFPANLHMAMHPELYPSISPAALWLRLPIQGLLIAWAYWYTRPAASSRTGRG